MRLSSLITAKLQSLESKGGLDFDWKSQKNETNSQWYGMMRSEAGGVQAHGGKQRGISELQAELLHHSSG